MFEFDYEKLEFEEEKDNKFNLDIVFKQNEDKPLSMNVFSNKICAIENIYYKDTLIKALYLYTKEYPNTELVILGSDSYPLKANKQLTNNIIDFNDDINLFCNYHEIISNNPSKEVLEMNYLLYTYNLIYTCHIDMYGHRSEEILPHHVSREYRTYKNDKKFKDNINLLLSRTFNWILDSLMYFDKSNDFKKRVKTIINNFINSQEISYKSFSYFIDFLNEEKNKKEFLDWHIIECLKKALSYYIYCFYENTKKYGNRYSIRGDINKASRKNFSNKLVHYHRPIVAAVSEDGKFKIFCINHLVDELNNSNNLKLTKFEKNSPALFAISVLLGLIALFVRLGREGAEHEMRMAIYKKELENAELKNQILTDEVENVKIRKIQNLTFFLKNQTNILFPDYKENEIKEIDDLNEILDLYEVFIQKEDLLFDYRNTHYGLVEFERIKKSVHDQIKDIFFDKDFIVEIATGQIRS